MRKTVILRFRDLVTDQGETIKEHTRLLKQFGEVWWGWWARQTEKTPRKLLQELANAARTDGFVTGYLFNSGTDEFYSVKISRILVAPENERVKTPDPERSPEYYHRAPCPAWFLLHSLEEEDFSRMTFLFDSFPTVSNQDETLIGGIIDQLVPSFEGQPMSSIVDRPVSTLADQPICSLDDLRHLGGVTLWAVKVQDTDVKGRINESSSSSD